VTGATPARDHRFEAKVALITGGAAGIGRRYAEALAAEGAAIAIADADAERTRIAVDEMRRAGRQVVGMRCDVADRGQVQAAVDETIAELAGIDILVNNAGAHLEQYSRPPVTELSGELWQRALDVNVTGVVNCCAAVRPSMRGRGGGVIVNQLTIAAYVFGGGAYTVTKAAARTLVGVLAHELAGDGIRVYGIAPGLIDAESTMTSIAPEERERIIQNQLIKRLGTMDDCTKALLFFCSDDASFITGECLVVGGGYPINV
jgi:NAD(P)-dependent dehydrogenase (short-subunit alcohol dehydrogenase family)